LLERKQPSYYRGEKGGEVNFLSGWWEEVMAPRKRGKKERGTRQRIGGPKNSIINLPGGEEKKRYLPDGKEKKGDPS